MTGCALAARPQPASLFAGNDFIAFGAIQALREARMDVPADMSVAVFDDLPPGRVLDPSLTVVSPPAYEIGRRAAELRLERFDGRCP